MLNFKSIGPRSDGRYLVGYQTPGCDLITVSCDCRTESQANDEVIRLNRDQIDREDALRDERMHCGLIGTYAELGR